jgi:hypothetical protein
MKSTTYLDVTEYERVRLTGQEPETWCTAVEGYWVQVIPAIVYELEFRGLLSLEEEMSVYIERKNQPMTNYYDEIKFPGLVVVEQTSMYDYDWNVFTIFKEPETGYYYWIEESGCSCTGPLDDTSKADLDRGDLAEMRAAFKVWLDSEPYMDPNERIEYLEKLNQIR